MAVELIHHVSQNPIQHASVQLSSSARLFKVQNPIMDSGTIAMAIGALLAGIGALLSVAGLVAASPFLAAGGIIAGVGAVTYLIGLYLYTDPNNSNPLEAYWIY